MLKIIINLIFQIFRNNYALGAVITLYFKILFNVIEYLK